MDTLAERAAWLASHTGVSLSETDALAGKTRGHWQAIVAGNATNPTLSTLSAYAEVCGASVGWLGKGEGDAPSPDDVKAAIERAKHRVSDTATDPRPSSTPPSPASKAA
jgi:hypothetical protein